MANEVSLLDLRKAIVAKWDDENLDFTFLGGMYVNWFPASSVVTFPYVVIMFPIGLRSLVHVEFNVYDKIGRTGNDPYEDVDTFLLLLKQEFDFRPLTIESLESGNWSRMRSVSRSIMRPDELIIQGRITFELWLPSKERGYGREVVGGR